ncbi:MAG: phytanoyl-CoA dioxygenase family protein [Chitinophagales bacterium]|nr:phytanoyl-CoA dioxygenase family protein [Chitinophagales bacterium]
MLKVFRNDIHQLQFERDGFLVLPFYNQDEIRELNELYHRLHPKDEKGFFPSTFSKDKNYRKIADEEIRRIGQRSMSNYIQDVKVMCGSFIVKSSGPESAMCVHQDMTLVDEAKYTGINIWIPLIDLNDENGTLEVLPGSHRIFPTYRSSTVPGIYDESSAEIKKYLVRLYPKAGEAIFFDQSIIHYSDANLSNQTRIVTNTYFTHKDATFQICYWQKDFGNKVELFREDEHFMTDFEQFGENIHDRPKIGKSLGLYDYDFPKITPEQLNELYGKNGKSKKSLFKRVLHSLFS